MGRMSMSLYDTSYCQVGKSHVPKPPLSTSHSKGEAGTHGDKI